MPMGRLVYMVLFTPLTSYALPFSLLLNILFYKKKLELLVFNLENIHIDCILGRVCVNEDFYDLLAQVITFYIFLKSDMFEKKTERQKNHMKIHPGPCRVYENTPE